MGNTIALKYVITLMEASLVDVIMDIYWMLMELLVTVYRRCIKYIVIERLRARFVKPKQLVHIAQKWVKVEYTPL